MQAGLLDRLLGIVPKSLTRFSFANSGAEAVENAIKVARAATGKQNVIAFDVRIQLVSILCSRKFCQLMADKETSKL